MKKDYDDGRVIADMSGITKRPLISSWLGLKDRPGQDLSQGGTIRPKDVGEGYAGRGGGPYGRLSSDMPDMGKEERRAAVLGAVKASLLIGLIYLAVFGAFIYLLTKLF